MSTQSTVPEMDGQLAYPRKNGEPVFDAPWQSRAFGMVVGLHNAGLYPWDDFKELLVEEIANGSHSTAPEGSSEYYYQWMDAFSRLLVAKGVLSPHEIEHRVAEFRTGARQDVF